MRGSAARAGPPSTSGGPPKLPDSRLNDPRTWHAVLPLVTVALYARTVGFGWVFDDQMDVVRNTYAHGLGHVREIFTTTVWAGSGMETYLYRPLVVLSYAANHAVSELAPWSYHLVNVLLAALISLLVFRLGLAWRLGVAASGVGALLFAVHPTHVEVVANVAGRKDLLAGLFLLGMVLAHGRALGEGGDRRNGAAWMALGTALYGLAMLSKEVAAVGLLLVAAQDVFLESDRSSFVRRSGVRAAYALHGAALLAYLAVRGAVAGGMSVPETYVFDNPIVGLGHWAGLATAAVVVGKGLLLLLVPRGLSPDYSFDAIPVVSSPADPRIWLLACGAAAAAWLARSGRLRGTAVPLLAAWYALSLLPSSNLLIRIGTIFGERLLFLPGVSLSLGLGTCAVWLARRSWGLSLVGIALASTFAAQTWRYAGAWSDDVSLFRWAVASVPESTKAHHKLGEELLRTGDLGGALVSLQHALRIAPDNEFAVLTLREARSRVAELYADGSREAPRDPYVLHELGLLARGRGDMDGATAWWQRAVAADPGHAPSLGDLGTLRLTRGDTAAASDLLQRAVTADPSLATAWFNLSGIHLRRRDADAARHALTRFLDAAGPRYPEQVAWARGALRELDGR